MHAESRSDAPCTDDDAPEGAAVDQPGRAGGNDALCFTAGYSGGLFGLGVVHAYLVSDRKPPAIAAGISYGAFAATALQQAYARLEGERDEEAPEVAESRRWQTYREFLWGLIDKPFESIWRAIPDRSDFFAGYRTLADPATPKALKEREDLVIRRRDVLVALGRWLYGVPVRVSGLAHSVAHFVSWKDGWVSDQQGQRRPILTRLHRLWNLVKLLLGLLWTVELLTWYAAFRPSLVPPLRRQDPPGGLPFWRRLRRPLLALFFMRRPLFGWRGWGFALGSIALTLLCSLSIAVGIQFGAPLLGLAAAALLWLAPRAAGLAARRRIRPIVGRYLCQKLGFHGGLVDDFHLRVQLHRLLGADAVLSDRPFPIILPSACLQVLLANGKPVTQQLVYPKAGTPLAEALITALRPSPVFAPLHYEGDDAARWLPHFLEPGNSKNRGIDLLTGDALRHNPLPALFTHLRWEHFQREEDERSESIASRLSRKQEGGDASIHVVYSVPLGPSSLSEDQSSDADTGGSPASEGRDNIVDLGFIGLRLARRRDTQMEVRSTRFISRLEELFRSTGLAKKTGQDRILPPLYPDAIAPERELRFDNPLAPSTDKALSFVAQGCRRSLERLYSRELENLPADRDGKIACAELLSRVTSARRQRIEAQPKIPGLAEVCRHCSGRLRCAKSKTGKEFAKEPTPEGATALVDSFPDLGGRDPRIVVLLSGGVFRGSFHAGIAAALATAEVRPNLVAGASVGTLVGGALGSLLVANHRNDQEHFVRSLDALVDAFVNVDHRVALTRRLLNAVRQVTLRASKLHLAPRSVRKMLLAGSRRDPSYSATGAPAALIDAVSSLFLIPIDKARRALAEFLAGHHVDAVDEFWEAVKADSLSRLYIQRSIFGSSLLRRQVRKLLASGLDSAGVDPSAHQPFHDAGVAFLATATNLNEECLELLGASPPESFSFLDAALASSAFPVAFSPVRASSIFPGVGDTAVRLADGGMFDNLPFFPALRTLARCQTVYGRRHPEEPITALRRHHEAPDLFVVGALDVNVDIHDQGLPPNPTFLDVMRRTAALKANSKIRGFQNSSIIVHRLVEKLLDAYQRMTSSKREEWQQRSERTLLGTVEAGVLPIFPADKEHLNPTFAFCASTGLERPRMRRSIADGCFQTFHSLVARHEGRDGKLRHRSLGGLRRRDRIPRVRARPFQWILERAKLLGRLAKLAESFVPARRECPYFEMATGADRGSDEAETHPFVCPFAREGTQASTRDVYVTCCRDTTHQDLHRELLLEQRDQELAPVGALEHEMGDETV